MAIRFKNELKVFVYQEHVDLRAGFNKLSHIVREKIGAKIVDGDLYLFLGKNRKRLKAICYDGTGLVLITKRMEQGKFMRLDDLEQSQITVEELDWLMRGSTIRRAKFGSIPLTTNKSLPQFI